MPEEVVSGLRDLRGEIAAQLRHDIEATLAANSPRRGRRSPLIEPAIRLAVAGFIELANGSDRGRQSVSEAFHRLGEAEAQRRDDLARVQAAWQVGTKHAWQKLGQMCRTFPIDAGTVVALGDLMLDYLDELFLHVEHGFFSARPTDLRSRLGRSLLLRSRAEDPAALARAAGWHAPERVVVVVVEHRPQQPPRLGELGKRVLAWSDTSRTTLVLDAVDVAGLRPALEQLVAPAPMVLSWPVAVEEIADAHGWARRMLRLRKEGRIGHSPVIDCADYLPLLVLEADPRLRDHLIELTLAPLLTIPSHHKRRALAETLLLLLTARASANAVAARLGVHPRTVHNRRQQLAELFGAQLNDPAARNQLAMALSAALPLWRQVAPRKRTRPAAEQG